MKRNSSHVYHLIPSAVGDVGVVRSPGQGSLQRILLPRRGRSMDELIRQAFPGAVPEKTGRDPICLQLRAFLEGEAVDFSVGSLDMEGLGRFARRVLMADHAIPRGRVMTYGGLAAKAGIPGGARAVGNVMARNPFPLIIPCHRVVGSGGNLHGFGGGLPMKKTLLEMEGVCFDGKGRVCAEYII